MPHKFTRCKGLVCLGTFLSSDYISECTIDFIISKLVSTLTKTLRFRFEPSQNTFTRFRNLPNCEWNQWSGLRQTLNLNPILVFGLVQFGFRLGLEPDQSNTRWHWCCWKCWECPLQLQSLQWRRRRKSAIQEVKRHQHAHPLTPAVILVTSGSLPGGHLGQSCITAVRSWHETFEAPTHESWKAFTTGMPLIMMPPSSLWTAPPSSSKTMQSFRLCRGSYPSWSNKRVLMQFFMVMLWLRLAHWTCIWMTLLHTARWEPQKLLQSQKDMAQDVHNQFEAGCWTLYALKGSLLTSWVEEGLQHWMMRKSLTTWNLPSVRGQRMGS